MPMRTPTASVGQASCLSFRHRRKLPSASGIALLLTLVAVVTATILAAAYLHAQTTATGVAQNVDRHAVARHIAESALAMAIHLVQQDNSWRTTFPNGVWIEQAPLLEGSFTLRGEDDDGDLTNNPADPVTLTVTGYFRGVTHIVSARITTVSSTPGRLLFVTAMQTPDEDEQARIGVFRSWGWMVVTLAQNASASAFNAACADARVVYIPDSISPGTLSNKLTLQSIGLVCENEQLWNTLGLAASGKSNNGNTIEILNDDHPITAGFTLGEVSIADSTVRMVRADSSLAPGAVLLAKRKGAPHSVMWAVDRGEALLNGEAPGRRVALPFGGGGFDITALNENGRTLIRQSLIWAAANQPLDEDAHCIARYTFEPQSIEPRLVGHWRLDDLGGGGAAGGAAVAGQIEMKGGTIVDAYESSRGAYGGSNVSQHAVLSTNATSANAFSVMEGARLNGTALVGAGGNPSNVIRITGGAVITGDRVAQETNVDMSPIVPPNDLPPATTDLTVKTSHTLSADASFRNLDIRDDGQLNITGHVRLWISDNFEIRNAGRLVIAPNASLTVWVGRNIRFLDNARVHNDSATPGKLTIYGLGNTVTSIDNSAIVCGLLDLSGTLQMKGAGQLFGTFRARDKFLLWEGALLHVDMTMASSWSGGSGAIAENDIAPNPGAYHSVTLGEAGRYGTAAAFNGVDSHLVIPDHEDYHLHRGAIAFWIRPESLTGEQGLISKDAAGYGENGHLYVYLQGSRLFARLQQDGVDYIISDAGMLQANQWYHVIFAWGPAGMLLYRNGSLVASGPFTGGLSRTPGGEANREPIIIGANASNSLVHGATPLSHFFKGRIDDIRIYDQTVDEAQALRVYQNESPGTSESIADVVRDVSEVAPAVDLLIADLPRVTWQEGGGLRLLDETRLTSLTPATKLYDRLTQSGEFSIVARFTPENVTQSAPVVSYGLDATQRNVMLSQSLSRLGMRLRTSSTGSGGTPEVVTDDVLRASTVQTVVVTYDGEELRIYRNGKLEVAEPRYGELSHWDVDAWLSLANEVNHHAPWLGTLHELAIYERVLTAEDVRRMTGSGGGGGRARVRWLESP